MANRKSLVGFIFSSVFVIAVSFWVHKWDAWESQKLITWDCAGYYLYLPGVFYDNLGELNNRQYIIDTYHPSGSGFSDHIGPTGKHVIKYSCGMAILYLPGFIAGHIYATLGSYPVDGFSFPYQFSMGMYSLLVTILGLWLCRKLLLKYFSDGVTTFTLLSLVLATNYLNYGAISNMFSHSYLFTIYISILLLSIQWHKTFEYKHAFLLGILCGLSALSRPTEAISALIPFLWGVGDVNSLKERIKKFSEQKDQLLILVLTAIAIGSIQFLYWKVYTGKFLYWSYADSDDKLDFLRVHFYQCMFSYKKGWLVYTPFMLLSIIGLVPLYRKDKKLFLPISIFIFIAFYIVFSWKNWAYGGSFSMRAVVQYYALLIFPLATWFEFVSNKRIWLIPTLLYSVFCVWLNLIMHYQANFGGMECDNMNKAYFWKIFGRIHIEPGERKLTEIEEELPAKFAKNLQPLHEELFCANTQSWSEHCTDFNGSKSFLLTKESEFIPEIRIPVKDKKGKWLHTSCEMYVEKGESNPFAQPLIYNWLIDSTQQEVKRVNYHFLRYMPYEKWDTITIDIFIPPNSNGEVLKCGIYNPKGEVRVYVRKMKIEYTN